MWRALVGIRMRKTVRVFVRSFPKGHVRTLNDTLVKGCRDCRHKWSVHRYGAGDWRTVRRMSRVQLLETKGRISDESSERSLESGASTVGLREEISMKT